MCVSTDRLALLVPCPVCKAGVGAACTVLRPRGRVVHPGRADRAVRAGRRGAVVA